MKASTLLRVSSVLTFLYFLGHSIGYPWMPSQGGATETVVGLMRSFHFDVFGSERTYWDFYLGFGLTVSVLMLLEAVVLWLVAGIAVKDPRSARPFAAAFLLANLAQLGLVLRFFFLPPLVLSVLNTACLALALWASFRGRYEPTRT
jgi:hypothetical protein